MMEIPQRVMDAIRVARLRDALILIQVGVVFSVETGIAAQTSVTATRTLITGVVPTFIPILPLLALNVNAQFLR
jgi:hypothetical protein